jgi:CRP/FNR family transcriptional regulator, anaerobic regulatory protein
MDDPDRAGESSRPLFRPAVYEDLAQGEHDLRRAFERAPSGVALAGTELISAAQPSEALYVLRRGWACRVRVWPDGRRAIPEIHLPGDLVGLGAALRARPADAVVTVEPVTFRALDAADVARLLTRPSTGAYLAWLAGEAQLRAERRADLIARFGARQRIAAMLLDFYERLRRRELIKAASYNLPLKQQQIGDHLGLTVVHVNRTLRQLREQKVAILDRHVVMIRDMERLRNLANDDFGTTSERAATDDGTPIGQPSRTPASAGAAGEPGAED